MKKMMTVCIGYRSEIAFDNDKDAFDFYSLLKKGTVLKDRYIDSKVYITKENNTDITLKVKDISDKKEIKFAEEQDAAKEATKPIEEVAADWFFILLIT